MNDIIITRREQFRTEIRKQSLEKIFKLKRVSIIPQNHQIIHNNNLIQYELNFTNQFENQIQQILNNPTNTKIEKLIYLIQELDIQNKINLINKNVYELLKSPDLDLNLTLLLMYTLCNEPIIIKYIFFDQTQTDRLMQFINYINDKQMDANIFMYWEFLYTLSISQNTPFLCLKQIYTYFIFIFLNNVLILQYLIKKLYSKSTICFVLQRSNRIQKQHTKVCLNYFIYYYFLMFKQLNQIIYRSLRVSQTNFKQQKLLNIALSLSARIFPQIIQKFPENFQFYWDTINQLDDEGRRPWKCILYFLKQQIADFTSCQFLLFTINYFIKKISENQEDFKFYQIVNPELISILLLNMNRHEKTLVASAQLFFSIFEKDNTYFPSVIEDLIKLLYNTSIEGQIEVLNILDLLLRDENIVRLAIRSQNIVEQLFNLLESNIQITINYLALKCIFNSITRCSNIQLFSIICNQQYKYTLERYSLEAHKQLKEMAQQLLDFYFEY